MFCFFPDNASMACSTSKQTQFEVADNNCKQKTGFLRIQVKIQSCTYFQEKQLRESKHLAFTCATLCLQSKIPSAWSGWRAAAERWDFTCFAVSHHHAQFVLSCCQQVGRLNVPERNLTSQVKDLTLHRFICAAPWIRKVKVFDKKIKEQRKQKQNNCENLKFI